MPTNRGDGDGEAGNLIPFARTSYGHRRMAMPSVLFQLPVETGGVMTRATSFLFRSFPIGSAGRRRRGPRCGRRPVETLERRTLLSTFTVNTVLDTVDVNPGDGLARDASGRTSLRAAVMEANALAGADTINLPAGTYALTL